MTFLSTPLIPHSWGMERMQRGFAPLHAPFVIPAEAGIPNVTVSTKTPLNPLATFLGELGNTPKPSAPFCCTSDAPIEHFHNGSI